MKTKDYTIVSSVEIFKKTPLHIAIKKNNIAITKLLLEKEKVDVNVKSYVIGKESNLIEKFCHKNKYLLSMARRRGRGITKLKSERTALFTAFENGNIDIVKLLLESSKIDVNIKAYEHAYRNIRGGDSYSYSSTQIKYVQEVAPLHIAILFFLIAMCNGVFLKISTDDTIV